MSWCFWIRNSVDWLSHTCEKYSPPKIGRKWNYFGDKKFFLGNFDFINWYKNEFKYNNEKLFSWSENGFRTKSIFEAVWPDEAMPTAVELKMKQKVKLISFLSQYDFFFKFFKKSKKGLNDWDLGQQCKVIWYGPYRAGSLRSGSFKARLLSHMNNLNF